MNQTTSKISFAIATLLLLCAAPGCAAAGDDSDETDAPEVVDEDLTSGVRLQGLEWKELQSGTFSGASCVFGTATTRIPARQGFSPADHRYGYNVRCSNPRTNLVGKGWVFLRKDASLQGHQLLDVSPRYVHGDGEFPILARGVRYSLQATTNTAHAKGLRIVAVSFSDGRALPAFDPAFVSQNESTELGRHE
jgi:hypothetical protein